MIMFFRFSMSIFFARSPLSCAVASSISLCSSSSMKPSASAATMISASSFSAASTSLFTSSACNSACSCAFRWAASASSFFCRIAVTSACAVSMLSCSSSSITPSASAASMISASFASAASTSFEAIIARSSAISSAGSSPSLSGVAAESRCVILEMSRSDVCCPHVGHVRAPVGRRVLLDPPLSGRDGAFAGVLRDVHRCSRRSRPPLLKAPAGRGAPSRSPMGLFGGWGCAPRTPPGDWGGRMWARAVCAAPCAEWASPSLREAGVWRADWLPELMSGSIGAGFARTAARLSSSRGALTLAISRCLSFSHRAASVAF
mmetsp:Transcript_11741/g.27178  ORF Transcript_11741/g.27178 Transcript_11741/m.27178 type:complete len:319 (-) Transcript_11741:19-975(-)